MMTGKPNAITLVAPAGERKTKKPALPPAFSFRCDPPV
jgi:hypothetical protein